MFRKLIRTYCPGALYRVLQAVYSELFYRPPLSRVSLDFLRDVDKINRVAPKEVRTAEAVQFRVLTNVYAQSNQGSTYTVPEDYVSVLDDLLYSPIFNVVFTDRYEVIFESQNTGGLDILHASQLYHKPIRSISGHCTLLRSTYNNYYHTLVDNLPRLLTLLVPPFSEMDEIKLLCPGSLTEVEKFFLSQIPNSNFRVIELNTRFLFRVEHLLFTPFKTRRFAGYLPEAYADLMRAYTQPLRPSTGTRLFISRADAQRRTIKNQDLLIPRLKSRGFEVIKPEHLSPAEQADCFYDAEMIVGAHGAGLTNALYAKRTYVLELFPANFVVPHYYYLCKSLGHSYSYLCGDEEERDPTVFEVDIDAVLQVVDRAIRLVK